MLKLPAMRAQLQLLVARSTSLRELCEAYDDTCVALERLRSEPRDMSRPLVREYETICSEIESDIILYCVERGLSIPK
jgi:hypothetical protein